MPFRQFTGIDPGQDVWFNTDDIFHMIYYKDINPPYTFVRLLRGTHEWNIAVREPPQDIRAPGPE